MSQTATIKDKAGHVGAEAQDAGRHVAGVASEQASQVAGQAGQAAKDLLGSTRGQVQEQAAVQQQKAAEGLRSLGNQLRGMAEGSGQSGLAADLAHEAAGRVSSAATWLEQRGPGDLFGEVQHFARRRPGTFLAVAAGVGVLAGRLTRGLAAGSPTSAATPSDTTPAPVMSPAAATTTTSAAGAPTMTTGPAVVRPVSVNL